MKTKFMRSFLLTLSACALSATCSGLASAQEETSAAAQETETLASADDTTASIKRKHKRSRKAARHRSAARAQTAANHNSAAHPTAGGGDTASHQEKSEDEPAGTHSGDDSKAANDPTTPRWTIENDNYPWFSKYKHKSSGYEGDLRIVAPWKIGDRMILTRFNIPLLDTPRTAQQGGRIAGPSDISIYNWAIFHPKVMNETITFGIGPMMTIPVGKVNSISEGKWQVGATAVVVTAPSWGTAGAMFQWQKDVGNSSGINAKGVNAFALQPFIYYNLPGEGKYYLRSSAIMSYDTIRKTALLPVGFGIGKVFTYQDRIMNVWVEPQYTVARRGTNQTRFQVYVGFKYLIPGTVNALFANATK